MSDLVKRNSDAAWRHFNAKVSGKCRPSEYGLFDNHDWNAAVAMNKRIEELEGALRDFVQHAVDSGWDGPMIERARELLK